MDAKGNNKIESTTQKNISYQTKKSNTKNEEKEEKTKEVTKNKFFI